MANKKIIYGRQIIIESIKSGETISKVYINKKIKKSSAKNLFDMIKKHKIPFSLVPIQKLNKLTTNNHQGVVAILSKIKFSPLIDILEKISDDSLFILLDNVTDTKNMGAIIRSAAAANATAVIIPSTGTAQITSETIKASAGGVFQTPICRVIHLKDALHLLKSYNVQSIVADEKSEKYLFSYNLNKPLAIVMGSEEKGVSSGIKKICSASAKLPILGPISSYNVSVAAGIFLYEVMRQRHNN